MIYLWEFELGRQFRTRDKRAYRLFFGVGRVPFVRCVVHRGPQVWFRAVSTGDGDDVGQVYPRSVLFQLWNAGLTLIRIVVDQPRLERREPRQKRLEQ